MAAQEKFSSELWAEFWRVSQRAIQKWVASHKDGAMPHVSDIPGMLAWELTAKKQSQAFRARCAEIRVGGGTVTGPSAAQAEEPKKPDLDWQEFRATMGSRPKKEFSLLIQQMEEFAAFYHYKLERAHELGDKGDQRFFNDLFIETSNAIRQQKLAADKLGIEEGQLFTKAQLEKFIRAFVFWSMRAIDADLAADPCKALLNLKSVEQVRAVREPRLLADRFVKPFARAARIESDSALSPWMVETVKDAVDDFIENGAKEFEAMK